MFGILILGFTPTGQSNKVDYFYDEFCIDYLVWLSQNWFNSSILMFYKNVLSNFWYALSI